MRRWAAAIAVLLLASGCSSSASSSNQDPDSVPEREQVRVLFVGDSLSEGYYATRLQDSFVQRVLAGWPEGIDVTAVLAAQAGARTWRLRGLIADDADVDVVVIEAGANDVGETPPTEFARDYRRLVARAEQASPKARVMCLGPWGAPRPTAPYDELVDDICDEAGRDFAPLSDLYGAGTRGPVGAETFRGDRDDYHPNDRGHRAIAERVLDRLAPSSR